MFPPPSDIIKGILTETVQKIVTHTNDALILVFTLLIIWTKHKLSNTMDGLPFLYTWVHFQFLLWFVLRNL